MKIHGGHKKMKVLKNQIMKKTSLFICTLLFISNILFYPKITFAYPFWAQQNYESPREATGKIVCANCHLAQMPTIAEVPQSVGADSVFKAVVKIPYKNDLKEIGADGSEVPLQVGAVVMLPDGFKLAPQERWTEEIKEETEGQDIASASNTSVPSKRDIPEPPSSSETIIPPRPKFPASLRSSLGISSFFSHSSAFGAIVSSPNSLAVL